MTISPLTSLALSLSLSLFACSGQEAETDHDDMTPEEIGDAFEEAAEELKDDSADNCSGVKVPDRGPFAKRIALTFDDGPNPVTTPTIMDILRQHDAPATFFINGNRVTSSSTRAIVKEMVDDPLFTLANHTWSHKKMKSLSSGAAGRQIDDTNEVIEAATSTPFYFRFPYGSSNCSTMRQVTNRGMVSVGWHIDSADWCFASGNGTCRASTFGDSGLNGYRDSMSNYIMKQARGRTQGGVLLFHDIHKNTQNSLDGILDRLEADGFEFVALDGGDFPRLHGEAVAPPKFIGSECETKDDCPYSGGFCGPHGMCTKECIETCPDAPGAPLTRCVIPPEGSQDSNLCALSCATEDCRNGTCYPSVEGPTGSYSVCF